MNKISRYITGAVTIAFSVWFVVFIGLVNSSDIDYSSVLFGIFFLFIGLYIIFNKKEDRIEEIKKD